MAQRPRRILVVEDQFLIALDLQEHLAQLGYVCVGPAATLAAGMELAETATLDGAILNVLIGGERIDPLCKLLEARGIPFAFATGVTAEADKEQWSSRPRILKPFAAEDVTRLMQALIETPAEQ